KACKTMKLYDSYGDIFLEDNKLVSRGYREFYLREKIREEEKEGKEKKEESFDPSNLSTQELLRYYLPRILSISSFKQEISKVKQDLQCITIESIPAMNPKFRTEEDNIPITKALKMAGEWMEMISSKRANERNAWIEIGWTLFNIGNGCKEAYRLWTNFSKKTDIPSYFSEAACAYEWNRMTKRNMGLSRLKFIARQDSPEKMAEWSRNESTKRIPYVLQGGHYELAKMLKEIYGHTYVYAGAGKDSWYQFENHRWRKVEEGLTLRTKIASELVPKFQKLAKELYLKTQEIVRQVDDMEIDDEGGRARTSTDDPKDIANKLKAVNKIITNLNSTPFKNSILKECQEVFLKERFQEKLDTDQYLLGFENGVLDLRLMKFRLGKPEDYI